MRSIAGRPSAEGGVMAFAQQKTIREDLEEQVEYWRQRAEDAEQALYGHKWDSVVKPLTLSETRIMRLIARRPMSQHQIALVMENYSNADDVETLVKVMLCRIRRRLPENIEPIKYTRQFAPVEVRDREALRAFLGETDTPDIRRVA